MNGMVGRMDGWLVVWCVSSVGCLLEWFWNAQQSSNKIQQRRLLLPLPSLLFIFRLRLLHIIIMCLKLLFFIFNFISFFLCFLAFSTFYYLKHFSQWYCKHLLLFSYTSWRLVCAFSIWSVGRVGK